MKKIGVASAQQCVTRVRIWTAEFALFAEMFEQVERRLVGLALVAGSIGVDDLVIERRQQDIDRILVAGAPFPLRAKVPVIARSERINDDREIADAEHLARRQPAALAGIKIGVEVARA